MITDIKGSVFGFGFDTSDKEKYCFESTYGGR